VANVKISALPAISSLTGTEAFPVVQSGTTSQITSANLRAYVATDTYVRNHANAAFDTANSSLAVNLTQNNSIASAFVHANAAFASANNTDGVNVTQNNSITAAFAAANAATATNTTQNNSITASFAHANAAFTAANNTTSKTTGSWTVTTGTNTYSFTVPESNTYLLWVDCNIPNGILAWSATAVITNTNVPVVGAQYAWVYNGGGSPVDFTSIPNQFTGTSNTIVRSSVAPSATTNRFDFGINNSSGGNITVRYGWVKIG
jgi:hypothetical protein